MRYNPSAAAVPLDRLRAGVAAFEADLDREIAGRARTLFVDAETSADLGIIAEAVLHRPSRFLPVGSAGLCTALAEKAADVDRPPDLGSGAKTLAEGRVLVVVGSLHQASRAQAKRIAGRIGTHAITVGPGEEESAARQTLSLFGAGGRVVLATTPGDPGRRYQASLLKRFAQSLLQGSAGSLPFDGLVLTGGETALQICRGLRGLQGIAIVGEIEPGVVRATLRPEEHGELGLALKAGGFGDEGALCRCAGLE